MIPFILTQDSTITMVLNNKPYTITNDHLNYNKIVTELKKPKHDIDLITKLIDIKDTLKEYTKEDTGIEFDWDTGTITHNGNQIHGTLVDRIFTMYKGGFDFKPMCKFLVNLYNNPSYKAIEELYSFIEYGKLPITEDGYFLAYKKVNDDYTSCYDNTTPNDIGTIVSMPRQKVDDNSNNTCSSGLHLCSYEYLQHFQGCRVVILKVNPKDVVSIPTDYSNTKARACAYEVIGEVSQEELLKNKSIFDQPIFNQPVYDYDEFEYDESDDEFSELEYDEEEALDKLVEIIESGEFQNELTDMIADYNKFKEDYINHMESHGIKEVKKPDDDISPMEDFAQMVQQIINDYNDAIDAPIEEQPKETVINLETDFVKAAYNSGYYEGKNKLEFDHAKVETGDIIMTSNHQPHMLSRQQAQEINVGYELGYKHGKGHKTRLFKDSRFTNTDIVI